MSDFQTAHKETMGNEGGYANNPKDAGGETYKGIARKYWPKWDGWRFIDGAKRQMVNQPVYGTSEYHNWVAYLNRQLALIPSLQKSVVIFYEMNFWTKNRLGEIQNQQVATWIYDHIVNAGTRGAIWAQLAARVTPDGQLGNISISSINTADPDQLVERMGDIAGAYRLDRAASNPSQIQFLVGWLRRDGQPENIIDMVRHAVADGQLDESEIAMLKKAMEDT